MSEEKPDHIPTISAVMTPFPWVVEIGAPLARAKEMMKHHDIRHLPVTEHGRLVGIITDRDIHVIEGEVVSQIRRSVLRVKDVVILDAYVVETSARLDEVLLQMAKRHIGSALVAKDGKIAGIFTATDACRQFGQFLRKMFPKGKSDEVA